MSSVCCTPLRPRWPSLALACAQARRWSCLEALVCQVGRVDVAVVSQQGRGSVTYDALLRERRIAFLEAHLGEQFKGDLL